MPAKAILLAILLVIVSHTAPSTHYSWRTTPFAAVAIPLTVKGPHQNHSGLPPAHSHHIPKSAYQIDAFCSLRNRSGQNAPGLSNGQWKGPGNYNADLFKSLNLAHCSVPKWQPLDNIAHP